LRILLVRVHIGLEMSAVRLSQGQSGRSSRRKSPTWALSLRWSCCAGECRHRRPRVDRRSPISATRRRRTGVAGSSPETRGLVSPPMAWPNTLSGALRPTTPLYRSPGIDGASRVHFSKSYFVPNAWLRSLGSLVDASTPHFGFLVRMEHRVAIRDQGNESRPPGVRNMRPSLAGVNTAHVAGSQRSLPAARCS
jgi:hypothetical protein